MPALARVQALLAQHQPPAAICTAISTEYSVAVLQRYEKDIRQPETATADTEGDTDGSGALLFSEDDETELQPGSGMWLSKRGEGLGLLTADKRRFFVLVRREAARTLALNYYVNCTQGRPDDLKGAIALLPNCVVTAHGNELTIVCPCFARLVAACTISNSRLVCMFVYEPQSDFWTLTCRPPKSARGG